MDAFAFLACACIFAAVTCSSAHPLGRRLGVIDMPEPGGRKRHARPTPLVGGLAAVLPAVFALAGSVAGGLTGAAPGLALALVVLTALALGFCDDRRDLRPAFRLAVSGAVLAVALAAVPDLRLDRLQFSFASGPLVLGPVLGGAFTLVCLLGLQNAVNMADGKNGLVIGLSLAWTLFLLAAAPADLRPMLLALAGALAVTGAFNLKGRLFLGDAGSYSLAILAGLAGVWTYNAAAGALPADLIALWFLIPVLDCLRLIVTRLRTGCGAFEGDRNHLHHVIADAVPWRHGLALYLAIAAGPGALGLLLPATTPLLIVLAGAGYMGLFQALATRRGAMPAPA